MNVDRSGKIKAMTLELFIFPILRDWRSAKELYDSSFFEALPYQSNWRSMSMRLLRYYRQGLLERKRYGRCYKYKLTFHGERRLNHLWEKFGMRAPPTDPSLTEEHKNAKMKLTQIRLRAGIRMDMDRKLRLQQQMRQLSKLESQPFYGFELESTNQSKDDENQNVEPTRKRYRPLSEVYPRPIQTPPHRRGQKSQNSKEDHVPVWEYLPERIDPSNDTT